MALLDDLEGTNNFQEVKDILNTWRDTLNAVLGGGTTDQVIKKVNATDFNTLMVNSILPASGTANLKIKVIDIGDWNMDATTQVTVAHGIADFTKIRSINAVVRTDGDTSYYNLLNSEGAGSALNTQIQAQSTNVVLGRATDGIFDSTTFDSTGFNRGWITIIYEG